MPGGATDPAGNQIYVGIVWKDPNVLISTFFHELGHIYCYRMGKFPIYHASTHTKKGKIALRRTALRAERYADDKGSELCQIFMPGTKYFKNYRSKEHSLLLQRYWAEY